MSQSLISANNALVIDADYTEETANFPATQHMYDGNTKVDSSYYTAATSKGAMDGRVSRQWFSRPDDQKFLNLNDLHKMVLARSANSFETVVKPSDIRVDIDEENNGLLVEHDAFGGAMAPSHYAFTQLCSQVGAPAGYLRNLPAKLAGINLQYGLMKKNQDMKAFTYKNGSSMLRAVTSETYGRIHDHEVVEQVMKIAGDGIGETRWKVPGMIDWSSNSNGMVKYNPFVDVTKENTTLYASDRDVYLFLVDDTHPIEIGKLPNGEPDLVFRGFIVWNSEVGYQTFGMSTMLLRGVCQNRNLWGVEGSTEIRIRHSKSAPDRFIKEAAPMLLNYSNAPEMPIIQKVNAAKSLIVAKTDEERKEFLNKKVGLPLNTTDAVIATVLREEQKPAQSIWDMVQGITAVARKIQHADSRIALEEKAGKLMDKVSA